VNVLLLAGLGPYFKQGSDLIGTLFDRAAVERLQNASSWLRGFRLEDLSFTGWDGKSYPLLRREKSGSLSLSIGGQIQIERTPIPTLSASTLVSILTRAEIEHDYLSLEAVWEGRAIHSSSFDCVLLSTTFICDHASLARAISWITDRLPGIPVILGGQFSNLKYREILRNHPEVFVVVRGDAELALPQLLRAMARGVALTDVPNLALRGPSDGDVVLTSFEYVDLETYPAPVFARSTPIVPYESMRGCPYACRFCSFPAASPKWRHKSAERIVTDWARYRDENGTVHIRSLDSTFTVPRTRFDELLDLLPSVGIGWEAFTRADMIASPKIVEALARSNCRTLSIGFESMSDNSLEYMDKRVSAAKNRRAFKLLRGSPVGYRMSFMVGYPGETPADYAQTHSFLVNEFEGHFQLSVFSLQDVTMPVWQDAARFGIRVSKVEDPDYSWSHCGMDVATAVALRKETLREVRWKNDAAVPFLWQTDYQTPVMPHRSVADNYRIEKILERIGFLPVDFPDANESGPLLEALLAELEGFGISVPSSVRVDASNSYDTRRTDQRTVSASV
jgi:anaerobic magnesium-protoporphyrin IX monomethyl ester cyclase